MPLPPHTQGIVRACWTEDAIKDAGSRAGSGVSGTSEHCGSAMDEFDQKNVPADIKAAGIGQGESN